jgi:hypothetical protein
MEKEEDDYKTTGVAFLCYTHIGISQEVITSPNRLPDSCLKG